ncbi:MAG: amino acid aldolase or racemase-like protein [Candidatus Solibacter sp.]|jgi:D-serine deaminase-like pyridoxal phosphate-dependent protein|nr:amino acid aldolase or racemase-like protein [Candidatus Solibacter sp.]
MSTNIQNLLTPALVVFPEIVDHNIDVTLVRLNGNPERWRPHVKTAKLISTMRQMTAHGIRNFKCATTLELLTVCEAGASDVLVAFACWGPRARRVAEIALEFPKVAISALVEDARNLTEWKATRIGIFIDVNPGGNRTGIEQDRIDDIVELAREIQRAGLEFRGLHYYDGHHRQADLAERTSAAWAGYDRLMEIVAALVSAGRAPAEVITSGTPALPCSISYPGFLNASFVHRVSPGTVVYNDTSSLEQLPDWGYQPAVFVLATVISHPIDGIVTCDAGHKSVSADAGIPNCAVRGRPDLEPLGPSEEHLPIRVPAGSTAPEPGDLLYLLPRHVCPTVNNFNDAVLVTDVGLTIVPVTARGREAPLPAEPATP